MVFSVHLRPESLAAASDGSITGVVFIALHDRPFPDREWNDFPVVILSWWLQEAARLTSDAVSPGCFRFMDGPYWFEVVPERRGDWRVRLIDDRKATNVGESKATRHEILASLGGAAETLIEACRNHGWETLEVGQLSREWALFSARVAKR